MAACNWYGPTDPLGRASGKTGNAKQFGDSTFWAEKFRERYTRNLPFRELDRIVGNTSTVFQKWMDHPQPDILGMPCIPRRNSSPKSTSPS
jgi:hypothetical protein